MRTTTEQDLVGNLAPSLDSVVDDHAPILITRDHGKSPVVLMSFEDFSAFEETRHLLRSPANTARLLEAVNGLEHGEGDAHELMD